MSNPINSILQQFDQQQTPTSPSAPAALPTSAPVAPGAPAGAGAPSQIPNLFADTNPVSALLSSFDTGASKPVVPASAPSAGSTSSIPNLFAKEGMSASGNPINAILAKYDQPQNLFAQPTSDAAKAPAFVSTMRMIDGRPVNINPITNLFKSFDVRSSSALSPEEQRQSSRPDPENNVDEPWYSKTWDWMNKPLWDLHQYGTRTGAGSFERGIESSAEDIISGFFSPLNLALTVSTFSGAAVRSVKALIADKKTKGASNVTDTHPKNQ